MCSWPSAWVFEEVDMTEGTADLQRVQFRTKKKKNVKTKMGESPMLFQS